MSCEGCRRRKELLKLKARMAARAAIAAMKIQVSKGDEDVSSTAIADEVDEDALGDEGDEGGAGG